MITLEAREYRQMFLLEGLIRGCYTHAEMIDHIGSISKTDPDRELFIDQLLSILTDDERTEALKRLRP